MTTFHVWQGNLDHPPLLFQYVAPEDGDRPDGLAWTDPYEVTMRGGDVVLVHVGSFDHDDPGDDGPDQAMTDDIALFVPAQNTAPVQTAIATAFGN